MEIMKLTSPKEIEEIKAWTLSSKKALSLEERAMKLLDEKMVKDYRLRKKCLEMVGKAPSSISETKLETLINIIITPEDK